VHGGELDLQEAKLLELDGYCSRYVASLKNSCQSTISGWAPKEYFIYNYCIGNCLFCLLISMRRRKRIIRCTSTQFWVVTKFARNSCVILGISIWINVQYDL